MPGEVAHRIDSFVQLVAMTSTGVPVCLTADSNGVLNSSAVLNGNVSIDVSSLLTEATFNTKVGSLTESAPASDTASSGLNGRLQRIAQRLTSLIAVAATETTLASVLTQSDFDTKTGSLTESAPASDTASSGLNGRLQRIAQRLTSLIALLPSALVNGRLDVNLGAAPATVTVTSADAALSLSNYTSQSAASGAIKASPGTLYGLTILNKKASRQYLQLFNATSAPADSTACVWEGYLPASDSQYIDFGVHGKNFSTGISWSNSSTSGTKTIGSADCNVYAEYN